MTGWSGFWIMIGLTLLGALVHDGLEELARALRKDRQE